MQPPMDENMKINHFHALMRKDALLTFTHIPKEARTTLEDVLLIFRQKYVKPQGAASSRHKWQKLMFTCLLRYLILKSLSSS